MTTIQYLKKIRMIIYRRRLRSGYTRRSFFLGCSIVFASIAFGQSGKNLALADQYFNAGEYLTAANLYEQYLNPAEKQKETSDFPLNFKKAREQSTTAYAGRMDIILKQAESYRLGNNWNQALALYQQCLQSDPVKYADAAYWVAVCYRNLGNYRAAEETLAKYNPEAGSIYKQLSDKERSTLAFINSQLSRPDSVLYSVRIMESPLGLDRGSYGMAAAGNQFIFTSTTTDTTVEAGVNPNKNRLYTAGLAEGKLQSVQAVNIISSDAAMHQGAGSLSPDGSRLYFTQWKKEEGKLVSAIYFSTKGKNGWSRPVLLQTVNLKGYNSKQPFCTADGKYLYFASDRKGGQGNFDIWYAPIKSDGITGAAVNAGSTINTPADEVAPYYQVSGSTLVFSSDRAIGMGGLDLFQANGNENNWKGVENMGYPVNSSRDDIYFFAPENGRLLDNAYISSDRGSECCLATYAVSKTEKKKWMAGIVRDCADNNPVQGAEVVIRDANGQTRSMLTGEDGRYHFELAATADQYQLVLNKEAYKEKVSPVTVETTDMSNPLEEVYHATTVCMDMKEIIQMENVVSLYFDFDKSSLKEDAVATLDSIYAVLEAEPELTIQISGYTDGVGSKAYNAKLSDRRARACADYLLKKGIDAKRITFESFGDCCPVEMELINGRDNPDGRGLNRRALINIARK